MDLPPISPGSYNSAILLLANLRSFLTVKVTRILVEEGRKLIDFTFPTVNPLTVT